MKKLLIILLFLSIIATTSCSKTKPESEVNKEDSSANKSDSDNKNEPAEADLEINMQNYTLTVPSNYELLKGGHDGIKYNNAILKSKNSIAYELEFDFGIFFINSVESRKGMIAYEYGAKTLDISTEDYIQKGVAYTYTFEHDTKGTVQAIELVTGTNPIYYMRGYIDVKDDQAVNDPVNLLSSFMAKNIIMNEITAD